MRTLSTGDVLAVLFVLLLIVGSIPAVCWQIRRARREESLRDQILRAGQPPAQRVWDDDAQRWVDLPAGVRPGPGQFTAAEVAAFDDLVLAWDAPAFDPATDPQWAAGRARLLNDLNNQGDQ